VVYLAGGPLVHLTHRRPLTAVASLVLRAGLVVAGYALGHPHEHPECAGFGCASSRLMFAGGALAALTDALWLGWDR
jgi:hypothetical protein